MRVLPLLCAISFVGASTTDLVFTPKAFTLESLRRPSPSTAELSRFRAALSETGIATVTGIPNFQAATREILIAVAHPLVSLRHRCEHGAKVR